MTDKRKLAAVLRRLEKFVATIDAEITKSEGDVDIHDILEDVGANIEAARSGLADLLR